MDEFARYDAIYFSKISDEDKNFNSDKPYVLFHQVSNKGPMDRQNFLFGISKERFIGYLEGVSLGKSIGDPFSNENFDLYFFNGIDYHTRKNFYQDKLPPIEENELNLLFKEANLERKLSFVRRIV